MDMNNTISEDANPWEMVEVRQLASIGEAIFAKVNISRGTRIAAETPLITVPPINSIDEELWELCNAVDKITDGKSKELEKLPYSSKVVGIIKKGGHVDNRVWCFYKNRKLKNSDGKLLKGKKLGRIVNRTINLCMIYLVNNVQLGPGGKYGSGIFPLYTRINHSCVPNAYNSWNPTLERLTIHAIHDIKAGEQIFVDYIGKACRTRNQRNFSLHTAWDITCNCAACTDDRLDQLRYRMLVLDQALAAYECGASEEAHLEGIPKLETNEQALKAAEELVKLFKKQRLCGMELCKTLRECSRYALNSGAYQTAERYARLELKYETLLIGTETQHLREELYGAKYWVEYIEEEVKSRIFNL